MALVRFEPTTPVFELPKTFHSSHHAATVIGKGTELLKLTLVPLCPRHIAHDLTYDGTLASAV
jgi:hypothetical protein